MSNKYSARLVNDQGCAFDACVTGSLAKIREWAEGRGGNYKCIITKFIFDDNFQIIDNELVKEYSPRA